VGALSPEQVGAFVEIAGLIRDRLVAHAAEGGVDAPVVTASEVPQG
jgi:hypothetical protein